jgi:cell wall assembly regulator SMI1
MNAERKDRIEHALRRIDAWRSEQIQGVPEQWRPELARRHPPADTAAIEGLSDAIAEVTGERLPDDCVALLGLHDGECETNEEGQVLGDVVPTCPLGLRLLPIDEIRRDWEQRVELAGRGEPMDDDVVGHDRRLRWTASPPSRTSVPFAGATGLGYRLFVDLNPGPDGTVGQIIHDATEVDMVVLAADLTTFFERYADALEAGEFSLVDGNAIQPEGDSLPGILDPSGGGRSDAPVDLTFDDLEEGQVLDGVVDRIHGLTVDVDLGGVHGSLHVSNMGQDRVVMADKVVSEGERIRVEVLELSPRSYEVELRLIG